MDFFLSMGFEGRKIQHALDQTTNPDEALNILLENDESGANHPIIMSNNANQVPYRVPMNHIIQLSLSQYDIGGNSSCTMIACNFINQTLPKLEARIAGVEEVQYLNGVLMNGNSMYQMVRGESFGLDRAHTAEHMSIDDCLSHREVALNEVKCIHAIPFQLSITGPNSSSVASSNPFQQMLDDSVTEYLRYNQELVSERNSMNMRDDYGGCNCRHIGIVMTKPPETVCLVIAVEDAHKHENYLFDSHSRPQLGLQNGYLLKGKQSVLVEHLTALFPYVCVDDDVQSIQNIMYNTFEYTIFVCK